ncbi:MmpS family transport accessory protein [[Mycobacterium] holstebronense]|uniref:MmpS family transport accessory protein n=1 Tax=[Mycobacterium] holstebronense TaxID=3064288 RepID=A0ABM9LQB3_9MYCO|nr:MmpS family transport accessory protein [Mycolicibacter sp. MU0102]CAJ1502891.1 MmpS family transport accessory protein [Mycolicibacter sp. MU0102]
MVVVLVATLAGFAGFRIHAVMAPKPAPTAFIDESRPVIPKDVIYEVFGPEGTAGQVNYLDENSQPQRADFTTLPWSFTISTKLTSIFANVVAQGDSSSIGCRITVNGEVRDEQTVDTHNAQVFCLVKSA